MDAELKRPLILHGDNSEAIERCAVPAKDPDHREERVAVRHNRGVEDREVPRTECHAIGIHFAASTRYSVHRSIIRAAVRVAALIMGLALAPSIARADWLDDMPSVDEVALAVREQNRLDAPALRAPDGFRRVNGLAAGPRRIAANDLEWYAARLAGTLETLRWFLLLEALREVNDPVPSRWLPLDEPKRSTLQRAEEIARQYREVELALWRGVGKRPGYSIRLCNAPNTFLNRLGGKMMVGQACYLDQFHIHSDLQHVAAFRTVIFPRLFCEKGQEYEARYRQYFNDSSHRYPQPRLWDRPHNYVYKRINEENWPVIAQPRTNQQVCADHGGDADDNGVCDAWQAALKNPAVDAGTPSKCAMCPDPGPPGTPPYPSVAAAAWAGSREAVARTLQDEFEWGSYIYPVPGGYRYLTPVTSRNRTCLDYRTAADPVFDALFKQGRPASCRAVATFHVHPNPDTVEGLSMGDMQTAVGTGAASYMMISDNLAKLYVYQPGRSREADESIRGTIEPGSDTDQQDGGGRTQQTCPAEPATLPQAPAWWEWENIKSAASKTVNELAEIPENLQVVYYNFRYVEQLTE